MRATRVVQTRLGAVEVMLLGGDKPPVLFFPGGHCAASVDCGWSIYTSGGYGIVSFSRPGYGATRVGQLSAEEFVPAVAECCDRLGVTQTAGAVGVSFGGMQAIHCAVALPGLVPRLALHSCAPSTHAYPDSTRQALLGPLVFGPGPQAVAWSAIARLVGSEAGLRRMVASLSTRPLDDWWHTWSADDRARARELFRTMSSGAGFVNDLRQGRAERGDYRHLFQTEVCCPTLVTASRDDGGVAFRHAEDLAGTIAAATLVELDAPSHLFWIGPARAQVEAAVHEFVATTA
ncbi:alpha/beta fold hydrolase [Cellulomonas sp. URHD0024]|uniref:alpha/beta fold hydrolase n=1 Tax=Cellulomonas sp. URHD0024 TaxID=1302620 RepID=UPI0012DF0903|nr:alpha/beta hydrolase [Cellulomonas sp. URHD0024]